jgi:hypothetical protein
LAGFFLMLRVTSAFCSARQSVDDILHGRENCWTKARNF